LSDKAGRGLGPWEQGSVFTATTGGDGVTGERSGMPGKKRVASVSDQEGQRLGVCNYREVPEGLEGTRTIFLVE